MPHRIDEFIDELARNNKDAVANILETHVCDQYGRCAGCAETEQLRPAWPCGPRGIAALARRRNVNDRGLP